MNKNSKSVPSKAKNCSIWYQHLRLNVIINNVNNNNNNNNQIIFTQLLLNVNWKEVKWKQYCKYSPKWLWTAVKKLYQNLLLLSVTQTGHIHEYLNNSFTSSPSLSNIKSLYLLNPPPSNICPTSTKSLLYEQIHSNVHIAHQQQTKQWNVSRS